MSSYDGVESLNSFDGEDSEIEVRSPGTGDENVSGVADLQGMCFYPDYIINVRGHGGKGDEGEDAISPLQLPGGSRYRYSAADDSHCNGYYESKPLAQQERSNCGGRLKAKNMLHFRREAVTPMRLEIRGEGTQGSYDRVARRGGYLFSGVLFSLEILSSHCMLGPSRCCNTRRVN